MVIKYMLFDVFMTLLRFIIKLLRYHAIVNSANFLSNNGLLAW